MNYALEASFMNELSFPLRAAAHDIYVFENIDELSRMRLNGIDARYSKEFSLTSSQWREVLNTAILTRLSQFRLGKHLGAEEFMQLDYLIKIVLELQEGTANDVIEVLETAPNLQQWYIRLRKCIKQG